MFFFISCFRMIVAVIASFIMPSAYHLALIYVSAATMFFLVSKIEAKNLRKKHKKTILNIN